MIIKLVIQP